MGKILVRAQQQNIYNLGGDGQMTKAYVLRPVRYSTMKSDDIVNYCAQNSIVPKSYLAASMVALSQCIENFLLNGHSVEFPNLGIFSLTSSGFTVSDPMMAGLTQLQRLKVRFLPNPKLKSMVEQTTLDFDGVYDIAGETVLATDAMGNPTKTVKYYKKVVAGTTEDETEPPTDPGGNEGRDVI